MASSNDQPEEWLSIDEGLVTAAGVVALLGALLLGLAALMGSHALLSAFRKWVNQQEVPPTESAKSVIRQLHDAALASTSAATDAWRSTVASPPTS
jgi:hypothetical protein